jgi:hypothetical protein
MTGKERSMLEKLHKREKDRQILPKNGDRRERAHPEYIYTRMQYISTMRK